MTRMFRIHSMIICLTGAISFNPVCMADKKAVPKQTSDEKSHVAETAKVHAPSFRPQVENRNEEFIFSDLEFKVKPECLSPRKQMVFDSIRTQGGLRFSVLTDLLIEDHWESRKHEFELPYLHSLIDQIADVKHATDLPSLKLEYESNLERIFSSKTKYNADANTLVDICANNKLQCFSGTVLNQVVARKVLGASEYEKQHPVIIYEEGHVLPGFMVLTEQGWQLVGIESTIKGAAQMAPLLAKDLKRPMKIYDANDWILFQLFKDCLDSPKTTGEEMLSRATKKYSISPMAAELAAQTKSNPSSHTGKQGDSLGFGIPPDISGDRYRDEADEINPSRKHLPTDIFGPLPEGAIEVPIGVNLHPIDPLDASIYSKEALAASRKRLVEELSKVEGMSGVAAEHFLGTVENLASYQLIGVIGAEHEKPVLRAMNTGKIDWLNEELAKDFQRLPEKTREQLGHQLVETARAAAAGPREKLIQAAKSSEQLATNTQKLLLARGYGSDIAKSKLKEAVEAASRAAFFPTHGYHFLGSATLFRINALNSLSDSYKNSAEPMPTEFLRAVAELVAENATVQLDAVSAWRNSWQSQVPSDLGQQQYPFGYQQGFGHPVSPHYYGGPSGLNPYGGYPYFK